eukprot:GFYU01009381.1.p1 GENE.GFYU01009381.1~~GFYU01009381.1.p1  ORF type:complete len:128 (+),score=23.79 GFYU01009381.1:28-384(+)
MSAGYLASVLRPLNTRIFARTFTTTVTESKPRVSTTILQALEKNGGLSSHELYMEVHDAFNSRRHMKHVLAHLKRTKQVKTTPVRCPEAVAEAAKVRKGQKPKAVQPTFVFELDQPKL